MKKIIAGAAVAALALLGALIAPTAAQAHTGDLLVSSVCNTQTGQYDLTATLKTASTNLTGETRWRIGTASFEGTPSSASGMDRGPITTTGSQTVTLGTFSIPGTTTGYGPWVYAFTKWSDNYKVGSDGQLTQKLKGDCAKPTPPTKPDDKVTHTEWVDGKWSCGDTTVEQTREKSVTTYVWDEAAWKWVAQEPVVTTEHQTRDLTPDEIKQWQTADPDGPCFNRPEQPEPRTVTEQRTLTPDCVQPLDGTAIVAHQEREGTIEQVWDETEQQYVDGETVWGDWETVSTETVDAEQCAPPVPPTFEPVTTITCDRATFMHPAVEGATGYTLLINGDPHTYLPGTVYYVTFTGDRERFVQWALIVSFGDETLRLGATNSALADCDSVPPVTPEPPTKPEPPVKPTPKPDTHRLAVTGGQDHTASLLLLGIGLLAAGGTAIIRTRRKARR